MTSLITALDEVSEGMQLGENNHIEYKWSVNDIQEQLLQLYFQLVRTNDSRMNTLGDKFEAIVKLLSSVELNHAQFYTSVVLRLVCQTRDIVAGKGEYALAYMMLLRLSDHLPELAEYALEKFVQMEDGTQPYGSWKDLKYIISICKNNRLTNKCIQLINDQLAKDIVCTKDSDISLCAKWVPREGSKKHGAFFKLLARDFFKDNAFMKSATTYESTLKANKKSYTKK